MPEGLKYKVTLHSEGGFHGRLHADVRSVGTGVRDQIVSPQTPSVAGGILNLGKLLPEPEP